MDLKTVMIQLLTAFLSALGFSLLFGMRPKFMLPASMGGLLTWGVYLLCKAFIPGVFMPCFIAAAYAVIYAEFLARMAGAPSTLFVLPAVIPLVPGSYLYYAMDAAVRGERASAGEFGFTALGFALGIAAGLSVVTALRDLQRRK